MKRTVEHLAVDRQQWGGSLYGTLCRRSHNDGVDTNRTYDRDKVTCKFCLKIMAAQQARQTAK
ncbi:hypothetical protein HA052_04130 [Chromobacterium haemolyticum]|uniref:Uncharacterized protein n=1 Tax=Chromobacterium fluminis TaxID=3044269 RepID=A0ABX0L5U2_9NEIS|nr:hypothetical protein [Chromobacterium haemolyticum]NHR04378.1 hypothetical protein [Chromobacterium haemolyticum]